MAQLSNLFGWAQKWEGCRLDLRFSLRRRGQARRKPAAAAHGDKPEKPAACIGLRRRGQITSLFSRRVPAGFLNITGPGRSNRIRRWNGEIKMKEYFAFQWHITTNATNVQTLLHFRKQLQAPDAMTWEQIQGNLLQLYGLLYKCAQAAVLLHHRRRPYPSPGLLAAAGARKEHDIRFLPSWAIRSTRPTRSACV